MNKFDTLENYLKLSKILIKLYAPLFIKSQMLNSEDAIADIAQALMIADWKWNGRGTKYGYRKKRCEWAINRWIQQQLKYKKNYILSLNQTYNNMDHDLLYYIIGSKQTQLDKLISKENLTIIKKKLENYPNQKHSKFFILYLGGYSFAEIGRQYDVTRENVRQIIKKVGQKIIKI